MKIDKYQPGTFMELDDMAGGRRVAMVCKDGVTFWDSLDVTCCTPLTLHPSVHPVALGTMIEFAAQRGIAQAIPALAAHLRASGDPRLESDPLFIMRALWVIAAKANAEGLNLSATTLAWACQQAEAQALAVSRIHQLAAQYCS